MVTKPSPQKQQMLAPWANPHRLTTALPKPCASLEISKVFSSSPVSAQMSRCMCLHIGPHKTFAPIFVVYGCVAEGNEMAD